MIRKLKAILRHGETHTEEFYSPRSSPDNIRAVKPKHSAMRIVCRAMDEIRN
jgi:hypothetical protein